MNIGFLYEHPTWSEALIRAFKERDIELILINVAELAFATSHEDVGFDCAINRINVMPHKDRDARVVFQSLHYLHWLESLGVKVINGARAHFVGASKATQNGIFSKLGLRHPKSVAVYRPDDALHAAETIGFPIIIKPNIGGSGSGIVKYDDAASLQAAIERRAVDLGIDGTGLVQEFVVGDGFVYRVEVLGDALFYAIKQPIQADSFNYCAADGCIVTSATQAESEGFDFCTVDNAGSIQTYDVDAETLSQVAGVVRSSGADLGGVEYLVDGVSGERCFYDYNPYSNFVSSTTTSNHTPLLGFSPEQRYIDYVMSLLQ